MITQSVLIMGAIGDESESRQPNDDGVSTTVNDELSDQLIQLVPIKCSPLLSALVYHFGENVLDCVIECLKEFSF